MAIFRSRLRLLVLIALLNCLQVLVVSRPSFDLCNGSPISCDVCTQQAECAWCTGIGLCLNMTATTKVSSDPEFASSKPSNHHCSSVPSRHCNSAIPLSENDNVFDLSPPAAQRTEIRYEDLLKNDNRQRWALDMVKIPQVWEQGIFGTGIRVRVNDDGMDRGNPHWFGRFDEGASCDSRQEMASLRQHGTSVASIIGASNQNDNTCTVGIAPGVTLSSCYALSPDEGFLGYKIDQIDISSNSFERPACRSDSGVSQGHRETQADQCPFAYADFRPEFDPCLVCDSFSNLGYLDNTVKSPECVQAIIRHCGSYYDLEKEACAQFLDLIIGGECDYVGLSTVARTGITKGITEGRGGKGIVYVFAAGNSRYEGDDTNLKGYTSSRMTISVGAIGGDGWHAYYSTTGASVMITAPGGDMDDNSRHYTAQVGGGCMSTSVGTSFATPVVSSIVAMMLEVNPDLGWRDVQGILIQSSQPVKNDPIDDTATTNGAGFWHSNLYGFGIANAAAAVELSRSWIIYSDEKLIAVDSGDINTPIYDDSSAETTSSIFIQQDVGTANVQRQASNNFVVEAVEVLLDISHFSRGDLRISLTSPAGTTSLLHPGSLPENGQLGSDQSWKLMTVRNWGESPYGEWTLTLVDEKAGSLKDCVDIGGFSLTFSDGTLVTCRAAERIEICKDGDYNPDFFNSGNFDSLKLQTDDDGRTLKDACCVCGGGLDRNEASPDQLRHWTIAIFGRDDGESKFETLPPTPPPTASPPTNFPPSRVPTSSPSLSPTASPTAQPTRLPTHSPTVSPTTAFPSSNPSLSPSRFPTLMPSFAPSDFPSSFPSDSGAPSDNPSTFPSLQPSSAPATTSSAPMLADSAAPSSLPSNSANEAADDKDTSSTDLPSSAPTQPSAFQIQQSLNASSAPNDRMICAPSLLVGIAFGVWWTTLVFL